MKKNNTKIFHRGFTLAEVLITLIIIGIIAALTVPTLMQNVEINKNITTYKKIVAELNGAIGFMKLDNQSSEVDPRAVVPNGLWASDSVHDNYLAKYFQPYLRNSKIGAYIDSAVLAPKCLDGTTPASVVYNGTQWELILQNGASLYLRAGSNYNSNYVFIDVNGQKKPNKIGWDIFKYQITNQRLIPSSDTTPCKLDVTSTGLSCSIWFLGHNEYEQ